MATPGPCAPPQHLSPALMVTAQDVQEGRTLELTPGGQRRTSSVLARVSGMQVALPQARGRELSGACVCGVGAGGNRRGQEAFPTGSAQGRGAGDEGLELPGGATWGSHGIDRCPQGLLRGLGWPERRSHTHWECAGVPAQLSGKSRETPSPAGRLGGCEDSGWTRSAGRPLTALLAGLAGEQEPCPAGMQRKVPLPHSP